MESPDLPVWGYRFGAYEVDLRAGELRKHGIRLKLHEKPFLILVALLERPGEVVAREELQKKLWADNTFVEFDHNLNNAVARLREALNDEAATPRFVETLSRRGYRFVAPVEVLGGMRAREKPVSNEVAVAESSQPLAGSLLETRRHWQVAAAALTLALALAGGIGGPIARSWSSTNEIGCSLPTSTTRPASPFSMAPWNML